MVPFFHGCLEAFLIELTFLAAGLDSFAAFEEALYLAKRFRCDMVLLAGDLFHDNRPSRRTLYKTMEILRRYTMGQDPVQIQILGNSNAVNYLNPHVRSGSLVNMKRVLSHRQCFAFTQVSVDLPIFSIHGNHDDPSEWDSLDKIYFSQP